MSKNTFARVHADRTMDQIILDHLLKVGNITALEAQGMYKCRSLSRRIRSIKNLGYTITSVQKNDNAGQRYVRYHLTGRTDGAKALAKFPAAASRAS